MTRPTAETSRPRPDAPPDPEPDAPDEPASPEDDDDVHGDPETPV
jgi:hypothetical protein